MKKRRTIWQWLRDWWTPDDEEDADGYPGDVCLMCEGRRIVLGPGYRGNKVGAWTTCPACKGKGTV